MARYPRLDYSSKDYDSVLTELQQRTRAGVPDWTDFGPGNAGEAELEGVAYVGDLLAYYQDRQVNEAFLVTATERQNVINHLRLLGYELATATPSSVDLTVTLDSPLNEDYTWPRLSVVTTEDGTTAGEIQSDLVIVKGSIGPVTVSWVEGQTIEESLGAATGQANQRYKLGRTPYLSGSEQITVDGVVWTRVPSFLNARGTDQVYTVTVDADDFAMVSFGDGVTGAAPPDGSLLSATYRIGGGDHNVDVNLLTKIVRPPVTASGARVSLRVTNLVRAEGGGPRETIEHAKLYGPASVRSQERSVTNDDYGTNATRVPSVARALALTKNEIPNMAENSVGVFIVPRGGGVASDALRAAVRRQLTLTTPKTNTTRLDVFSAPYREFSPAGYVFCDSADDPNAQRAILLSKATAVRDALSSYYDPENIDSKTHALTVDFGVTIAISRLYQLIQDVPGVERVTLTAPWTDIALSPFEFPRLAPPSIKVVSNSRVDLNFASSPPTLLEFAPARAGA
jgi:hypothetical protein